MRGGKESRGGDKMERKRGWDGGEERRKGEVDGQTTLAACTKP